ncbi:MAG: EAL domain-containing protein, partial [Tumebacillaceae bacterium]
TILPITSEHQHGLLDMLEGVVILDDEQRIVSFDETAERLFARAAADVLGEHVGVLIPELRDRDWGNRGTKTVRGNGNDLELSTTQLYDKQGVHTVCVFRDLSKRENMMKIMRMATTVFHHQEEGFFLTDPKGIIQYVNPAFTSITGYQPEDVIGRNPNLLQSGWHCSDFYKKMWHSIIMEGGWEGEVWNKRKDGEIFAQNLRIRTIRNEVGEVDQYCALFNDITKHKQNQEQIHHQTYHDALTGLPNRLLFMDRLSLSIQTAQRLDMRIAVMFIDLDRFKLINDTLGHQQGDQLLKEVAKRLYEIVGEQDVVSRMGGDEFTVILQDIEQIQDAAKVAEQILQSFANTPFQLSGQEYFLSPSIGIAIYPEDGTEIEELMKNADTAMYRAKEHSNNYQLYTSTMNAQAQRRLALENDMRKALEREEFVVYYQPKVHIASGRVIGMEALVRWQHPTRGLVPPLEFIPLAEENGLIVPLGEWVLRAACEQSQEWIKNGITPMRLSVNLSARQFQQHNLPAVVDGILKETRLPAQYLELEITESITMHDVNKAIATMHDLKQLGIHISIDDFGTGYSSLNYLRMFPIQTLKIDKSFVHDISDDPDDAAIAASIIAMAHSLKLNVIAEGVETTEQLDFLRERNCDEMQGYLFSGPVPASDFEKLLKDHN